jgi:Pumilio-family RNA binding repeat
MTAGAAAESESVDTDDAQSQLQNEMRGKVVEMAKQQHGSK